MTVGKGWEKLEKKKGHANVSMPFVAIFGVVLHYKVTLPEKNNALS